jgi:aerotaxis receptor
MRLNEPVTQREYVFPDDATLMSSTDTRGRITYANAAFCTTSGFTREQLQGQPHNMVRHPDMPPEAFADMWASLKSGEPWVALVKNRRANGDHYWVQANATPVVRGGRQAGYLSVRTKPTAAEVAGAEALYRDFRTGAAGSRRFHKGLIVRTGLLGWTSALQTMPVRWRLRSGLLVLAPSLIGLGWGLGLGGSSLAMFAGATAALTLAAGWWFEAQIARPLESMCREALSVASGATQRVTALNRVDEIGMTMRSIGQLGLMFRWLIDDVSEQVITVQSASSEIAQGNNDLASRTEQAASSVQESASAMTQMTATVQSTADTASNANELSASASGAAAKGGQAVAEVVQTMQDITQSSKRIGDIIGVIDGIAFQTNILALNAAVEAARAGEQGRGFAVVAAEVRALAQRSATAAREIKELIATSVQKVESGSAMVDHAGRTMGTIVDEVKRVSQMIAEISAATIEQSTGITQVGQAMGHLDEITQQNAALVEQSAAASESLRLQAVRLVEAVSVFR